MPKGILQHYIYSVELQIPRHIAHKIKDRLRKREKMENSRSVMSKTDTYSNVANYIPFEKNQSLTMRMGT